MHLGPGDLVGVGLKSYHAAVTRDAVHDLIRQSARTPQTIISGNDTNFRGEFSAYCQNHWITQDLRARYSPWRNPSENCVQRVQRVISPALVASNLKYSNWERAMKHGVRCYNALRGSPNWRGLHDDLFSPFGCTAYIKRETAVENSIAPKVGPNSYQVDSSGILVSTRS